MEPMSRSGGLYHNVTTTWEHLHAGNVFSLDRPTVKRKFTYVDHEVIVSTVARLVEDRVSGAHCISYFIGAMKCFKYHFNRLF